MFLHHRERGGVPTDGRATPLACKVCLLVRHPWRHAPWKQTLRRDCACRPVNSSETKGRWFTFISSVCTSQTSLRPCHWPRRSQGQLPRIRAAAVRLTLHRVVPLCCNAGPLTLQVHGLLELQAGASHSEAARRRESWSKGVKPCR